jgi:hypothetical protein
MAVAAALSLVFSVPLHAAEVKVLDDLEKTIITDSVKDRCQRYQQSALALQQALDELNSGEEISSAYRISKALAQVAQGEQIMARASGDLAELIGYVKTNKERLIAGGLEMFLPLEKLNGEPYRRYEDEVKAYFAAFNTLLEFSKANLPALRAGKKAEMDAHEKLYNRYVTATDRQGEALADWHQFLFQFYQEYPLLRPFLEKKPEKEEMS